MNQNTSAEDQTGTLLTIDTAPVPLQLPLGSAIFAYRGEVWITQEGMQADVILGPGERFDVKRRALILASATKSQNPASVYVACPTDATATSGDLFALLRHRALRLRAEHFGRWLASIRQLVFPDQVRSRSQARVHHA